MDLYKKTLFLLLFLLAAKPALTQEFSEKSTIIGIKVSAGARYDNVRMCVASPPGKKVGPAMDVAFFLENSINETTSILVSVPVMRPVLFAAAFKMLQFEPEVALLFRSGGQGTSFKAGPSLGFIFHYGPDYTSERTGEGRGTSFWAIGPKIGAYVGLDFNKKQDQNLDFQLGLSPYISPLFTLNNDDLKKGIVVGGSLDALFGF